MLRQAERFSAVLEIATLLSSVRDLDALLRTVMDRLSSLLQAEAATLTMKRMKRSFMRDCRRAIGMACEQL